MVEMMYGGAMGIAAGLSFNRIAFFQVKRRSGEEVAGKTAGKAVTAAVSALISGILFALIFKLYGGTAERLEYAAYISIAISIGVVDLGIKKIPNLSVAALLAVRTVVIIYRLFKGASASGLLLVSLIGLGGAFFLFQLPMLLGIPVGAGDVKFASAIGYCLGIFGFLQSSLIMAAGLGILLK